jgi:hypothetical protein
MSRQIEHKFDAWLGLSMEPSSILKLGWHTHEGLGGSFDLDLAMK